MKNKQQKQTEAVQRQRAYSALSLMEKGARLIPGGSKRERVRLMAAEDASIVLQHENAQREAAAAKKKKK